MSEKIVILGAGESGTGAALLAKKVGYEVFVSDAGTIADVYKNKLQEAHIAYEEGTHSEDIVLAAKEIIKSPGIDPKKSEILQKAKKAKIKIVGEIEFAGRYSKGKKNLHYRYRRQDNYQYAYLPYATFSRIECEACRQYRS